MDTSHDHVHISEPHEVAEVIGWLCTDAARLVTGNVVRLRRPDPLPGVPPTRGGALVDEW